MPDDDASQDDNTQQGPEPTGPGAEPTEHDMASEPPGATAPQAGTGAPLAPVPEAPVPEASSSTDAAEEGSGAGASWQPGPEEQVTSWQGPGTIFQEEAPPPQPAETVAAPAPSHGGRGRLAAIIAVAVVVVAAVVGTSIALSSSSNNSGSGTSGGASKGASTPAGAVANLLAAADASNANGALDVLAPGERAALQPGIQSLVGQLQRLDVLSSAANLNDVAGVSLHFKNVKMTTDNLTSDVAAVSLVSGSVTSSVDLGQLPLGEFVKGLAGPALGGPAQTQTSPVSTGQSVIGTVKVNGSWYVSLGYTIAIDALKSEGQSGAPPAASQAVQATGATSPQGAVQDLFTSLSNLDLKGLVADLAPDEAAALDAYAPDWLAKAASAMSAYKGQVSIKFGNLTYTTQSLNDGTLVKVGAGMTFDIKAKGYSVSYADQCLTIEENSVHVPLCLDELKQLVASNLPPALGAIFQRLMSSSPAVGFVTVQENGHWFVSPTRSYLQDMVGLLALFKAQDLQTIATNVSSLENAYQKMLQKEMQSLGAGSAASMPSIPLPGL